MATNKILAGETLLGRFVSDLPDTVDYVLTVPSGFRLGTCPSYSNEAETRCLFQRIATLLGEGSTPSKVFLDVAMLRRECVPGDVAQVDFQENGVNVLQRTDGAALWEPSSRIVGELTHDGVRWITIARVVRRGAWIFRISASDREDRLAGTQEQLIGVIDSFRIAAAQEGNPSEQLHTHKPQASSPFSFKLPLSWHQVVVDEASDREWAQFVHLYKSTEAGRLCIRVFSGDALISCASALRLFSNFVKEQGVHVCGSPITKVDPPDSFEAAYKYQPIASSRGMKVDVLAWAMDHPRGVVLVGLIGPFRDDAPLMCSVNRRAHQIVRCSVEFFNSPT